MNNSRTEVLLESIYQMLGSIDELLTHLDDKVSRIADTVAVEGTKDQSGLRFVKDEHGLRVRGPLRHTTFQEDFTSRRGYMGLRAVGRELGLAASTLSRFERAWTSRLPVGWRSTAGPIPSAGPRKIDP